jgi:hypothetical protein
VKIFARCADLSSSFAAVYVAFSTEFSGFFRRFLTTTSLSAKDRGGQCTMASYSDEYHLSAISVDKTAYNKLHSLIVASVHISVERP